VIVVIVVGKNRLVISIITDFLKFVARERESEGERERERLRERVREFAGAEDQTNESTIIAKYRTAAAERNRSSGGRA